MNFIRISPDTSPKCRGKGRDEMVATLGSKTEATGLNVVEVRAEGRANPV